MATAIFPTYQDFADRKDQTVNGVSQEFAYKNKFWDSMNSSNEGCWNCLDCESCKFCVDCAECTNCLACEDCENCEDCEGLEGETLLEGVNGD